MHVREKKNSAAPAAKQSDMVGVERAWPVLFWVAGVLGFVLPKRQPSGHYRTSWVRLFPMVTITPLMCWFIFTYQVLFTNNSYDQVVDLLTYSACASLVAFTFALAIYKRRETCILFEGLSGKLKPAGKWVSLACSLLLLLDVGLFLLNNYSVVDRIINLPILGWFTMTMIYPVLPLLVDLHVAHSVRALNQVYAGTLSRILPGGSFSSWTRGPVEGLPVQNGEQPKGVHEPGNVDTVLHHITDTLHLVDMHNQVFSSWTLVRCGALLAKLLDSSYYFTVLFCQNLWGWTLYTGNEIGSFLFLCRQADLLKENHRKVEGALFTLQQQPSTPLEDRQRLLSLSLHLKSHPAHIAIGSVGSLGTHILIILLNVALTFMAILYQYRPVSAE
ncbi:hypothetical protein C7M84_008752 [Penaeus vannamei]|uniref:Gustatory receptor n=1 Tax=Penaeus vannamei TaxID=6689 RepID=A0A423T8V9_PENVA|nr:hypothetical protein C7M84_008752 [Penaeus vannamei]